MIGRSSSASPGVHPWRLRFRPVDTSFYDLFTESAQHLVVGAELLAEMLAESADKDGRRRAGCATPSTRPTRRPTRSSGGSTAPSSRRSTARTSTRSASGLDDVMDMMDEVVDLILLYEVQVLPPELSEQVEVLQRCAELTADAMPQPAGDEGPRGVLDRDQPARERRRQEPPPDPGQAVLRRVQDASRCSSSRTSWSRSRARSTRSRRSPTSSSRSPSRSPERPMELAIIIAVVVVALVFDYTNGFHDAANAIATSVSTRALTPRVALAMAAVMNFVGAFLGPEGRAARSPRRSVPGDGTHGLVDRDGRPARRDRLEPDHLVLRPALVVVARADRRPGRAPRVAAGVTRALGRRRSRRSSSR